MHKMLEILLQQDKIVPSILALLLAVGYFLIKKNHQCAVLRSLFKTLSLRGNAIILQV